MIAIRVIVGVLLLLTLFAGLSTFLVLVALTVLVAVVQALITGSARWAFIGSRSRVWLPAVGAMVALLAGGAMAPAVTTVEAAETPEPAVTVTRTAPPVTSTVTETVTPEPLPAETVIAPAPAAVTVTATAAAQGQVAPPPAPRTSTATPTGGRPYYENCTAVRNAGAAPIRSSDPGWQSKFDRDGDGVGCEV